MCAELAEELEVSLMSCGGSAFLNFVVAVPSADVAGIGGQQRTRPPPRRAKTNETSERNPRGRQGGGGRRPDRQERESRARKEKRSRRESGQNDRKPATKQPFDRSFRAEANPDPPFPPREAARLFDYSYSIIRSFDHSPGQPSQLPQTLSDVVQGSAQGPRERPSSERRARPLRTAARRERPGAAGSPRPARRARGPARRARPRTLRARPAETRATTHGPSAPPRCTRPCTVRTRTSSSAEVASALVEDDHRGVVAPFLGEHPGKHRRPGLARPSRRSPGRLPEGEGRPVPRRPAARPRGARPEGDGTGPVFGRTRPHGRHERLGGRVRVDEAPPASDAERPRRGGARPHPGPRSPETRAVRTLNMDARPLPSNPAIPPGPDPAPAPGARPDGRAVVRAGGDGHGRVQRVLTWNISWQPPAGSVQRGSTRRAPLPLPSSPAVDTPAPRNASASRTVRARRGTGRRPRTRRSRVAQHRLLEVGGSRRRASRRGPASPWGMRILARRPP